jgi:hypothetical protein
VRHLADARLRGSIDERAAALLKIVREGPSNHKKWKLPRVQIRAMTLELTAAAAQRGEPCGSDLLHLMAWAMDVPRTFLYDPSDLLSGADGKGQAAPHLSKESAELLDWLHFREHGSYMSINALAKECKVSRPSIREWVKGWRADDGAEELTGTAPPGDRAAVRNKVRDNLGNSLRTFNAPSSVLRR